MHSYSRQHLIDTTEACFAEITALCADLSDDEWTVQSLCPAWTARQAIGHAVGVEDVISGWEISTESMPPFQKMQALTDASAGMSSAEFGARVAEILGARRSDLAALTDEGVERPSWTPVGVQSYGGFLAIRIFDMWVHVRDCTIPLGRDTDDSGPTAEITLNQVEGSMGYIIGKKVGLPDGMSLRADITGPVERQMAVVVDGRAKAVDPSVAGGARRGADRRLDHVHHAGLRSHRSPVQDRRRLHLLERRRPLGRARGPQPPLHDVMTSRLRRQRVVAT